MTRLLAIADLLALGALCATAAEAAPWRGGLALRLDSLRSYASAGPTLAASATTFGLWVERGAPRCWSAHASLDGSVSGEVAIEGVSVARTSFAFAALAVGASHPVGGGWRASAALGGARALYFSPRVIGDSGWSPVVSSTLVYRNQRWWHGELGVRVLAMFDSEPAAMRTTLAGALFVGIGLGR